MYEGGGSSLGCFEQQTGARGKDTTIAKQTWWMLWRKRCVLGWQRIYNMVAISAITSVLHLLCRIPQYKRSRHTQIRNRVAWLIVFHNFLSSIHFRLVNVNNIVKLGGSSTFFFSARLHKSRICYCVYCLPLTVTPTVSDPLDFAPCFRVGYHLLTQQACFLFVCVNRRTTRECIAASKLSVSYWLIEAQE